MNMEYTVVDITITRNTLGIKREEFGTVLVIGGYAAEDTEPLLKEYFSLAEVLADYPDPVQGVRSEEYKVAQIIFAQDISLKKILIGQKGTVENTLGAYNRISSIRDFYAVIVAASTDADLMDLAQQIEADSNTKSRPKILAALEYDLADNTFTKAAHAAKLNRTFICRKKPKPNESKYMQAGWIGKMLPTDPGTQNWCFKTINGLSGETAADGLDQLTINELTQNCGNFYTKNGDRDVTFWGTMASGEYIDIIYGIDWLDNNMQKDLIDLFNRAPIINYTNAGISLVETTMRQSLDLALERGVIQSYTITVPKAADVSFNDKATRDLKNVTFQAIAQGAINKVVINGNVTL